LPAATQGSFYSTTLSATGDSPITWSIDSGSLPAGLSLNGNTISGTPTSAGVSTFTVKATNAAGDDTKSFTITVNAPPPPPAPSGPSASELATLNAAVECFAFDSAVVPDGAKGLLDSKAEILNKYPRINIVVVGHTDNLGSDSVNDKLGKNRAEAVKSYLVGKGVSGSRINTNTKGKKEPAVPNNSAANRCKNRRVTFDVQ
jgi:outer membrane protein OmpA-like peptidoglycan-associated protein